MSVGVTWRASFGFVDTACVNNQPPIHAHRDRRKQNLASSTNFYAMYSRTVAAAGDRTRVSTENVQQSRTPMSTTHRVHTLPDTTWLCTIGASPKKSAIAAAAAASAAAFAAACNVRITCGQSASDETRCRQQQYRDVRSGAQFRVAGPERPSTSEPVDGGSAPRLLHHTGSLCVRSINTTATKQPQTLTYAVVVPQRRRVVSKIIGIMT